MEDDPNSKQALSDLEEERLAVRYFIWSRDDKPFTYLPLENIREMLGLTNVTDINVRYFIWSREDKPFTYLPLETIREMLGLTNVTDVNALQYWECKLYLQCLNIFRLEGNSDFRLDFFMTGCGNYGIGVLCKRIMDYLGFEEGEDRSFDVYNIETTKRGTAVTQPASSTSSTATAN